jgi:hypothetical protein
MVISKNVGGGKTPRYNFYDTLYSTKIGFNDIFAYVQWYVYVGWDSETRTVFTKGGKWEVHCKSLNISKTLEGIGKEDVDKAIERAIDILKDTANYYCSIVYN